MFEIDKMKFGAFVASLRKEQGLTQKELAQRLYISDKAVSKWETGSSIPDVALLVPLAEELHITVTELLECRRIEGDLEQVESLVKKAISVPRQGMAKRAAILLAAALLSGAEIWFAVQMGCQFKADLLVLPVMAMVFGAYFWILTRDRLPWYYDRDRIGVYHHGPLRMNVPGVAFNNRNWPHIVRTLRIASIVGMVLYPLCYLAGAMLLPDHWYGAGEKALIGITAAALIAAVYITGKKYE